jgi:mRNA interferase MazF
VSADQAIRRGEIWTAELDPVRGTESQKTRPVLVISNDGANRAAQRATMGGVITVVPLTSNTDRIRPFQALIEADQHTGLAVDSKAQCEQIRSLDISRFISRVGAINAEHQAAVDAALTLHLSLG